MAIPMKPKQSEALAPLFVTAARSLFRRLISKTPSCDPQGGGCSLEAHKLRNSITVNRRTLLSHVVAFGATVAFDHSTVCLDEVIGGPNGCLHGTGGLGDRTAGRHGSTIVWIGHK